MRLGDQNLSRADVEWGVLISGFIPSSSGSIAQAMRLEGLRPQPGLHGSRRRATQSIVRRRRERAPPHHEGHRCGERHLRLVISSVSPHPRGASRYAMRLEGSRPRTGLRRMGAGDGRACRHPSRRPASLPVHGLLKDRSGGATDWFHGVDRLVCLWLRWLRHILKSPPSSRCTSNAPIPGF